MGVKVLKREYKNQFYPTNETTDWLLGNVGDWQSLEVTFEAKVEFVGTSRDSVSIDNVANAFVLNNGRSWNEYGFDIGDDVVMSYTVVSVDENGSTENSFVFNFKIVNLYKETMEIDEDFGNRFNVDLLPTDRGNLKYKDVLFFSTKEPEGLKFTYDHLRNDDYETDNIRSIIDGTKTQFTFAGLNTLPVGVYRDMNPDGFQSGMAIERAMVKKLSGGADEYDAELWSKLQPVKCYTRLSLGSIYSTLSKPIPMTKRSGGAEYKSTEDVLVPMDYQRNTNEYRNGDIRTIFLSDVQEGGLRYFELNMAMYVNSASDNSNVDRFSLNLLRYSGSGNLNFVSKTEIKSWSNASQLVGTNLIFNGTIATQSNVGDSFALAIEYFHPAQWQERNIVVTPNLILKPIKPTQGGGTGFQYRARLDFLMPTIFEEVANLENKTAPDSLFDDGSLTDNFLIEVFPEWNNPNTVIKNNTDHTERLGNTGWFDENFNKLDNNFVVESVRYFDDNGNTLTQLDYSSAVNVEVLVSGIKNLDDDSEFGFGFAWVPQSEDDYKQKETPYHQNLFINTGREYTNGLNDSFNLNERTNAIIFEGYSSNDARMDSTAIDGVFFEKAGDDIAKFQAKFIPTPEFTALFNAKNDDDRNYVLWVSVANRDLQINFSDRVSLLVDYKPMVKVIPPAGAYAGMINKFLEHPQNENAIGVEKYFGFIEDDVLARVEFYVDTQDDKFFRRMSFGYEVENTQTGLAYQLETYDVNLSNYPKDVNGVQNFDIDEIRGFKMNAGNNKNWVKIRRNDINDNGSNKSYVAYFATKIRWEDWIARDGVPQEFFDNTKLNDGYHNDWVDYLRAGNIGDHKFNFFVFSEVIENGELKLYKNTYELTFADYDENLNIETKHEYFRHSDNTLLNVGVDPESGKPLGVLLNNEPTRIEITYTNKTEDFDISKMYAVTTIEIDKGAGEFEHRQLSSVWDYENDNILIPLPNQTKLFFEQLSPRVVKATCLVDNTRLTNAIRYKVSGRIGCFSEGNGNVNIAGKYEARYENKYE